MSERGTILLAEDDENDAFLLQTALKRAEVHNPVVHTVDGQEALEYLTGAGAYGDRARYPFPCLLITDLKMPGFSGFDLLRAAKPILEAAHVPTIVLSASVSDSDRERSLALGAHAYFVKPPDLKGLMELAAELKRAWLPSLIQRV